MVRSAFRPRNTWAKSLPPSSERKALDEPIELVHDGGKTPVGIVDASMRVEVVTLKGQRLLIARGRVGLANVRHKVGIVGHGQHAYCVREPAALPLKGDSHR